MYILIALVYLLHSLPKLIVDGHRIYVTPETKWVKKSGIGGARGSYTSSFISWSEPGKLSAEASQSTWPACDW